MILARLRWHESSRRRDVGFCSPLGNRQIRQQIGAEIKPVLVRACCEPGPSNTYAHLAQQAAGIGEAAGGVGLDI